MKLRRFDRYVVRHFLRAWLVIGCSFLALFTFLDLLGKADEIGRAMEQAETSGASYGLVLKYYFWNLPFLLVQFAPFLTVLAGMVTVIQLRRRQEWTPILTAGRSAWRAFRPMLICAFGLGLGMFAIREWGFPEFQEKRYAAHDPIFRLSPWEAKNLWARSGNDTRLHAKSFRPGPPAQLRGMEVYSVDGEGQDHFLQAEQATWENHRWRLVKGLKTVAGAEDTVLQSWSQPGLAPRDLLQFHFRQRQPLDLSRGQLMGLLLRDAEDRQAATLAVNFLVAPLVHVLLLLLGLPFLLRFDRQSSLEGVAVGFLVCALFFVGDLIFVDLGTRGALSPWLAGSGGVFLFGSLGWVASKRLAT
jgi:lipopolysaccharide export LptBFGC system permease protein LptF